MKWSEGTFKELAIHADVVDTFEAEEEEKWSD